MVTIPDFRSLGPRNVARSSRGIASFDGGSGARALSQVGRDVQGVGADIKAQMDRNQGEQDRLESAKAALAYKQSLDAYEDKVKSSPDNYQNHLRDFDVAEAAARKQAANSIGSESSRAFFDVAAQELGRNRRRTIGAIQASVGVDRTFAFVESSVEGERVRQMAAPDGRSIADTQILAKNAIDPLVKTGVIDEALANKFLRQSGDSMQEAYWSAKISRDGMGAFRELKSAIGSRVAIGVEAIIDKIVDVEVGKGADIKVHPDNKGIAIGGINSDSYPKEFAEAKVALEKGGQSAARDYIRGFYENEIIKKRGIDKLPDDVQDVVADGVVNHWSVFQRKLISAAKGGASRNELIDMRQAEYDRLVATGRKEYTSAKQSWDDRLDGLRLGGAAQSLPFSPSANATSRALAKARGYAEMEVVRRVSELDLADKQNVDIAKDTINDIRNSAKELGMSRELQALDDFDAARDIKAEFSAVPLSDMRGAIEKKMLESRGDLSKAKDVAVMRSVYANKANGYKSDPYEYLAANNIIPRVEQSLLDGNPVDEVVRRRQYAETVKNMDGFDLPMITSSEVNQLVDIYKSGGKVGEAISGAMVNLRPNERRRAARQISRGDPFLGAVAAIDDPDVMNIAIAGSKADGHVTLGDFSEASERSLAGAFHSVEGLSNATQVAFAYYKQAAVEKGLKSTDPVDEDLMADALSKTIGRVEDVSMLGRVSRVIVPNGMSGSDVEDRLESLTRADVSAAGGVYSGQAGAPYSPEPEDLFKGRTLVTYGDGLYVLRNSKQNNDYLMKGDRSGFFVIDVNKINATSSRYRDAVENSNRLMPR